MNDLIYIALPVFPALSFIFLLGDGWQKGKKTEILLSVIAFMTSIMALAYYAHINNYVNTFMYADIFSRFFRLLWFPLFYIYIRMLCNGSNFSFKWSWGFLFWPVAWLVLYLLCLIPLSWADYRQIMFPVEGVAFDNLRLALLVMMLQKVCDYVFAILILVVMIINFGFVTKFYKSIQDKISDMKDVSPVRMYGMNIIMFIMGSVVATITFGNYFTFSQNVYSDLLSIASLGMLLSAFTGIGCAQRVLVLPDEQEQEQPEDVQLTDALEIQQYEKEIDKKLTDLMLGDKLYIDQDLTIDGLAQQVGLNRTYLSQYINRQYGVNFCSYVNQYRVNELKEAIKEHPDYSVYGLLDICGFGSPDTLKRAVLQVEGLKYQDFRAKILGTKA